MDAASNNSVEDIRLIRDEVNFLPTKAKYRVYIIDEVHMLSTGAFNALLKTLEEPPEHVKFILATTEPQKLPATILSRCQRFDFKKISDDNIAKWLDYVCKESNVSITQDALKTIGVLAEGAMRDALSILDRCIQDGTDEIDVKKVKDLVGIPQTQYINKILETIINKNTEECLSAVNEVINDGKDINNLLWETIKYVKDVLVYKTSNKLDLYTKEELEQISELASKVSKEELLKIIFSLSELENDIKWSTQKSIILQVGMMKLCSYSSIESTSESSDECIKKINELESRISRIEKNGISIHNSSQNVDDTITKQGYQDNKNQKSYNQGSIHAKVIDKPSNMDKYKKVDSWPKIVNGLKESGKVMLYTNLINSNARELNDMVIGIEFPGGLTPFGKTVLEKPENVSELTRLVSMEYGKEMSVRFIDEKKLKNSSELSIIENISKNIDMPINIIEE